MALCPVCRNALPETPVASCPNCGASVAATEWPSTGGEVAAPPPPPPPPPSAPPTLPTPRTTPPAFGAATRGRTPWDERDRIGLLSALVETTKQVLLEPTVFFRSMPVSGGIGSPLLYAVIVGWIGLVATALYQAVFRSIAGSSFAGFGERPELAAMFGWAESWAGFFVQAVFGGVFVVIGVFLSAGVLHLMLLLLGGARRDFETTARVVCFTQATSVVFLVPFCGQLAGLVWTIVLYVIGLKESHEIGGGKAAAAVLLPILLVCCCCGALFTLFASALASLVPGLAGS
jgi:hypothetical protein